MSVGTSSSIFIAQMTKANRDLEIVKEDLPQADTILAPVKSARKV